MREILQISLDIILMPIANLCYTVRVLTFKALNSPKFKIGQKVDTDYGVGGKVTKIETYYTFSSKPKYYYTIRLFGSGNLSMLTENELKLHKSEIRKNKIDKIINS